MLKKLFLILCFLPALTACSMSAMNYIPKVCKTGSFWVTVGLAATFSASIYGLNYWLDSDNKAFYAAVLQGDVETVRTMLGTYDIDYKRISKEGRNLLHCAVMQNNVKMAQLFAGDIDMLNHEDKYGHAPLYYAVQNGNAILCKMLRERGANWFCTRDFTSEFEQSLNALLS